MKKLGIKKLRNKKKDINVNWYDRKKHIKTNNIMEMVLIINSK